MQLDPTLLGLAAQRESVMGAVVLAATEDIAKEIIGEELGIVERFIDFWPILSCLPFFRPKTVDPGYIRSRPPHFPHYFRCFP
jgi:hypothetical protein